MLAGGAAVGGAGAARGFGPAVDVVSTPDAYLPKAHTCFFSLNLPKYTSDKVRQGPLAWLCACVRGDWLHVLAGCALCVRVLVGVCVCWRECVCVLIWSTCVSRYPHSCLSL